jgi:hypothetical protein
MQRERERERGGGDLISHVKSHARCEFTKEEHSASSNRVTTSCSCTRNRNCNVGTIRASLIRTLSVIFELKCSVERCR